MRPSVEDEGFHSDVPRVMIVVALLLLAISACSGATRPQKGIGDRVWLDANANGIQDDPDVGIADVVVRLHGESSGMVEETTTNEDGYYSFETAPDGTFFLEFIPPQDYRFTLENMGTDERDDSDVRQADGRTQSFSYVGGTDHSWDAGLILIETAMAWTPTPSPTATPTPTPMPDPALELRNDPMLQASKVIKLTRFDESGVIDPDGRYTSNTLEAGDPLLETVPFFLLDPYNNMYLGFAGELEGLAINFSGYHPGDSAYQPRIVFNFAMDESAAPSFETENMHFGDDPDVDVDTELMVSNLRVNLEDFHDARSISLWIYRAIFDEDGKFIGHKLAHVALSEEELEALIAEMEMASDLEEDELEEGIMEEGYIIGKVYRFEGEEIVEVSLGEALDALDEAMQYGRIPMDPEVQEVWESYVLWVENIEID